MKAFLDGSRGTALLSVLATLALATGTALAVSPGTASELTTGIGELHVARLAEGLTVRLNTGTHVRVSTLGARKRVEIVTGECMFEVEPDSAHTLEVTASSVVITDGNARFDVKRDAHTTTIVVIDGAAVVRNGMGNAKPLRLLAGEEAVFKVRRPQAQFRRLDDGEQLRRTAWTQGRLWFEGESLREVVAQLNRFNTRRLVIGDRALDSIAISGVFRPTDLETFLRALAPFGIQAIESGTPRDYADVVLMSQIH